MKKIIFFFKKYFLENKIEEQRIVKNSFWIALARFGGSLFRAILIIYSFRILGPQLQGSFSLAMNFVLIFSVVPDFGLTAILIREISKLYKKSQTGDKLTNKYEPRQTNTKIEIDVNNEKRKEILANAFLAVIVLLSFSLLIINLTKNIFIKDNLALSLIFVLSLFLVFDVLREFFYSLFRAKEKMELQALSHLITNFLLLFLGVFFLKIKPLPIYLAYTYLLASFLGFIFTVLLLKREICYNYFKFFQVKTGIFLLNKSWPIGLANFLFLVLTYLDSLIVGWFHSSKEVGFYSSVVKITEFLYFFPAALAMSIFPILSKKITESEKDEIKKTIRFGSELALLFSLPMFIGIFLLAKEIIVLLFGIKYIEASLALSLISFALPFNFLLLIFIDVLIALDKRRDILVYDFLVVFLNLILNLIFVPRFSYFAASVIASLSALISLIFTYILVKKYTGFSLRNVHFFNYLFSGILMGFLIYFLPWGIIFKIILGALIYFGLLFLLKDELFLRILKHQ